MTLDTFWDLIEQSRASATGCGVQTEALTNILAKLTPDEIIAFDNTFHELICQAYRWDLWAVAYIVNGGCGDDGFEYFRRWLIGQGRTRYEAALAFAERAADNASSGEEIECEELGWAAGDAYKRVTGSEMPLAPGSRPSPAEPAGTPWEEEDLEELYPKLWAKFT